MHAQLQHLAYRANLPNVDLRVLPLGGDRAILADSFVIFGFGQLGETAMLPDVVSIVSVVKSELQLKARWIPSSTTWYFKDWSRRRYRLKPPRN